MILRTTFLDTAYFFCKYLYVCSSVVQENPDLWKWLTGQEQPPEAVKTNPVSIQTSVSLFMFGLKNM